MGSLTSGIIARIPPALSALKFFRGARFAPEELLQSHFGRHAAEFGYQSAQDYLIGARRLTSGGWGWGIKTFVRTNRDTLFYDSSTNEFAVLTKNGIVRTYFRPEMGIQYWFSQIGGR